MKKHQFMDLWETVIKVKLLDFSSFMQNELKFTTSDRKLVKFMLSAAYPLSCLSHVIDYEILILYSCFPLI